MDTSMIDVGKGMNWKLLKWVNDGQLSRFKNASPSKQRKIPSGLKFSIELLDAALEKLIELEAHADKKGNLEIGERNAIRF